MTYSVEKGIPLPEKQDKRLYPIYTMEPGESFIVPDAKRGSVASACARLTKRDGRVFRMGFDHAARYRCWRVS